MTLILEKSMIIIVTAMINYDGEDANIIWMEAARASSLLTVNDFLSTGKKYKWDSHSKQKIMNELALYYYQNAYSEVLINMACLNKTGKRMGEVENEEEGQRTWFG